MNRLKYIQSILPLYLILSSLNLKSQDFGGSKVGISNFARRMYNAQSFNGVKLLQTEEGQDYMISVVELKKDPTKPESIQSRIASVKAKAYASQYINGSNVSTEVVIITKEEKVKDSVITITEMQESLKESSIGFADGMELLTNFESNDGKQVVYIYYREVKKK
jgi:hypothetical protein